MLDHLIPFNDCDFKLNQIIGKISTEKSDGPGPGAYNPDIRNVGKVNRVGGTFGMRPDDVAKSSGPGPNAYNVKDPTLKRQPTFAM